MNSIDIKNVINLLKDTVLDVINNTKLKTVDISKVLQCDGVQLEDVYIYDDIINSIPGSINHLMMIDHDGEKFMCFNRSTKKKIERPLKSKLADISTTEIIKNLDDIEYHKFIQDFYTTMDVFITVYANIKHLKIPSDICFFYKGGNVFRFLLKDLISIINKPEYRSLMNRSDADFQLFINPEIRDYEKVYNELSTLATYVLYCMKYNLINNDYGFIRILKEQSSKIINDCETLLNTIPQYNNYKKNIEIRERNDSIIDLNRIYEVEEVVGYKETECILENINTIPISCFYISKNTAIKFIGNNVVNEFDLIRMKMNIILKMENIQNKHLLEVSIPSEIIDIAIPKSSDTNIQMFIGNTDKCLRKYNFKKNGEYIFSFWAPSLQYLIKDIDSVLFIQNEFPWHDKKSIKRVLRYLLSLLMNSILVSKVDIIKRVSSYNNELKKLIEMLTYINTQINSTFTVLQIKDFNGMFHKKYNDIIVKLYNISDPKTKKYEIENMKQFNNEIIKITNIIIDDISNILTDETKEKQILLQRIHSNIVEMKETSLLG